MSGNRHTNTRRVPHPHDQPHNHGGRGPSQHTPALGAHHQQPSQPQHHHHPRTYLRAGPRPVADGQVPRRGELLRSHQRHGLRVALVVALSGPIVRRASGEALGLVRGLHSGVDAVVHAGRVDGARRLHVAPRTAAWCVVRGACVRACVRRACVRASHWGGEADDRRCSNSSSSSSSSSSSGGGGGGSSSSSSSRQW